MVFIYIYILVIFFCYCNQLIFLFIIGHWLIWAYFIIFQSVNLIILCYSFWPCVFWCQCWYCSISLGAVTDVDDVWFDHVSWCQCWYCSMITSLDVVADVDNVWCDHVYWCIYFTERFLLLTCCCFLLQILQFCFSGVTINLFFVVK